MGPGVGVGVGVPAQVHAPAPICRSQIEAEPWGAGSTKEVVLLVSPATVSAAFPNQP